MTNTLHASASKFSATRFQAGQIWIAYVHFADKPKVGKVRPVIVLDAKNASEKLLVSVCRITTRPLTDPNDIFIEEWETCGLVKPSCIRTDIIFELPLSDILSHSPIGEVNTETLMQTLRKVNEQC